MSNDLIQTARGGLRDYLESRVKLDLTDLSVDGLWEMSDRGEQMEMAGLLLTGLANRELSTRVDSQKLAQELRQRGKPRAKFYYAMQAVEAFEALPDQSATAALAALGPTKVRALMSWHEHERAAFASGATVRGLTIDEAAELPTREFEKLSKPLSPEVERLATTNAKLETELSKFRQQARAQAALRASEDLPLFAREPREEALLASEAMMQSLELIDDAVLRNLLAEVDHPEALRWQPAAARTVAYALGPVAMRIGRLIKELRERFGDSVIGPLDADSFLEPSEALGLMMGRQQLLKQAQELAQGRDDARANSTPGKRGRKRGTKIDTGA